MTGGPRAKDIFLRAVEVPAAQRAVFLDGACGGDRELQRVVEELLALHDEHDGFLRQPTADAAGTSDLKPGGSVGGASGSGGGTARVRESAGTMIGPYKLLQQIGEGGFGSVFMAEQSHPVQRKVALKIIKLGMDTEQVVARFEQERQALAIMDHPNIAKVLDAGATETGRPYFVMELCKGEPITTFADRNNLSIDQRLELFTQVCNAVQHAHTKGIIHRDIKPSNVLVSEQDGRPHAKVIDFGIAKATARRLTEKTLFTEHQQLIGTPEYMSPEQAGGSLDVDTRTDVYSLGVLLYELLTGSTPFSGKELRSAAFGELQRIIREVDPPRPSTRLSQSADTLAMVAARRQTEPRRLGTLVRGELDWIVMKALEKDRARRYETASGLAMDIHRYISGEAVVAAPPSRAYRVRKFIGRHRGAVIGSAVVAGALVLGVVGTSVGMFRAQRERQAAIVARASEAEQRALAESRLAEAEATVKFLDEMLGAADPLAQGREVTVRSVLDRAAESIGTKFRDRPLVAAQLHRTIGGTYLGLGVYGAGEPHFREALTIRTRELGAEHPDTRRAVNELGWFLVKSGNHAEAERLLKQAVTENERLFGRTHVLTVQSLDFLGNLYTAQMRPGDAATLLEEVVKVRSLSPGKEHIETLSTMNALGVLYTDTERFDEADKLLEDAFAVQSRVAGREHPFAIDLLSNIAWSNYAAGMAMKQKTPEESRARIEKSRKIGEELLPVCTRVMGEEHPLTMNVMNNLASTYKELGMHDRAIEMQKKDVEISVRTLGEEHPDAIVSIANLGNSYRLRGRCAEGLPYLERAVKASRKALPPDSPGMAFALGWYGSCLRDMGRLREAEPALIEGRAIIVRAMGEEHPIATQMSLGLAMLYEAWEKAEPGAGYEAKRAEWRKRFEEADAKNKAP